MLHEGQLIASGPTNVSLCVQNFQAMDNQYDQTLKKVFKNSRVPLIVIKQNNQMILTIFKNLLSSKFHKTGIFETLWLSIAYWTKVSVESLRNLLNIEDTSEKLPEFEDS